MKARCLAILLLGVATISGGCVTTALAPGAAQVRMVRDASSVSGCTAVGNVATGPEARVDVRNLAVGLGGNTVFVTAETFGVVTDGVAYRCP